ncbi:MAG: hypothetical protein KOO63_04305 [Bacteroidales bacterium]|nr:hypothetical protein [Candidatus Latescibacterota bacterium]
MRRIIAIILLIASSAGFTQSGVELYQFKSVEEAMEVLRGGNANIYAATWIARQIGLDWPSEQEPPNIYGEHICGYLSPNRKFCLLVGMHTREWVPSGNASYCLMDGTGRIYWTGEKAFSRNPQVSNTGIAAILYRPWWKNEKGEKVDYHAELIDTLGISIHGKSWMYRVEREMERDGAIREYFGFAYDGSFFFMTMNVSDGTPEDAKRPWCNIYNNTYLYTLDLESSECYEHYLGEFKPSIPLYPNGNTVIIAGFWNRNWEYSEQVVGDFRISNNGKDVVKRVYEVYEAP